MKIDYLSSSTLFSDAANAVHVMRMSNALAAAGHEVTLHALKGEGDSEEEVFAYYGTPRSFTLLRHHQEEPFLPRLLGRLRSKGLPLGPLIRYSYAHSTLSRRVSREEGLLFARNLEWLAAVATPRSRFIFESHSPPTGRWQRLLHRRLFRHPGFLALVVISEPLKAAFLASYPCLDPGKVIVAHDGADEVADPSLVVNPRLQLGYVGHLYPGRGGELMVELARRLPEVDIHLVGGREDDIARLKALLPPPNVLFHGHQPPARLAEYFARFDVLLAPYQRQVAVAGGGGNTAAFMSPLKIFEYMAWGRAIIASDLPVLHEVLAPDETALMVDPGDANAWIEAIRRLAEAPELREKLGANALHVFKSRYSWKSRAARILSAALPAADEL